MKATTFSGSTIGKKLVMAVTGFILFGFVVGHMLGNLQVLLGPEELNDYSVFLHHMVHGAGIWVARSVLAVAAVLHVWSATALTLTNWSARPIGYRKSAPRESTYSSRTMRWSGVLLGAFIVFHILHLTTGTVHPAFVEGDVYHNVIVGLQAPLVAIFYSVAMVALGMHLYHGAWSMLQTRGLSHARWNTLRFGLSTALAMVVVAGNLTFPATILAGLIS